MSNSFRKQENSTTGTIAEGIKKSATTKLYVAHINKALIESCKQNNALLEFHDSYMPLTFSPEEEAMLYDKYY